MFDFFLTPNFSKSVCFRFLLLQMMVAYQKRDNLLNFELQSDSVMENSLGRLPKISYRSIIPGQTFTLKVFGLKLTPESFSRDFNHIRTISVSFLLYCIVELFDKIAINCLFTIVLTTCLFWAKSFRFMQACVPGYLPFYHYGWKVNDSAYTGKSVRKFLAFVPVVHSSYFQSPILGAISFAL